MLETDPLSVAFRDLIQRGDVPGDEITMEGLYGVRVLDLPILDFQMTHETAIAALKKLVAERERVKRKL